MYSVTSVSACTCMCIQNSRTSKTEIDGGVCACVHVRMHMEFVSLDLGMD